MEMASKLEPVTKKYDQYVAWSLWHINSPGYFLALRKENKCMVQNAAKLILESVLM